tara:strand:- start:5 stop:1210 length:1206 start_codon:yes stop_codon:yes gene_type:complete
MTGRDINFDLSVIGGLGHVGLPLSIKFAEKGLKVCAYDINKSSIDQVKKGKMPFIEYGSEEVLLKNIKNKNLIFTNNPKDISKSKIIMVCIGTPIDEYLNPKTEKFLDALNKLRPYFNIDQVIIIRSSIFPKTCKQILELLGSKKEWHLAYCPERIVQGHAFRELEELPQIISGNTKNAITKATELFSVLTTKIVHANFEEAELAKLFSNAWRYIKFGIANEFYMIADDYGQSYSKILKIMKKDYDRNSELPMAGFTAGPCLLKDTMQLSSFYKNRFLLGQAAMIVNEGLPNHLVENLKREIDIRQKSVGILGMAFKADIDDIRGSLSYKLRKILAFEGAKVLCSDPFVKDSTFLSEEDLLKKSDIIIVGAPHSSYSELVIKDKLVVDIWNIVKNENLKST